MIAEHGLTDGLRHTDIRLGEITGQPYSGDGQFQG